MDPVPELIQPEAIGHVKQLMDVVIGPLEQLSGPLDRHRIPGQHPLADPPYSRRHLVGLYRFHARSIVSNVKIKKWNGAY